MVRVGDGGGGEEGIDPAALQSMISTMKSSAGHAATLVDSYKSQFSRLGVDTASLTQATQDLTWAQDQVPMLSRRQSLAQAAADMDPGVSMVTAGADSLGNYPTNSAAQQAGQQDAKKFQNGDMSAQDLYAKLAANQGDPAYCTALMQALGADGLRELEQFPGYDPADPSGTADQAALAQAVALAMWNGFTVPEGSYEENIDGNMGREDPAVLARLLPYATFPPQVMADLGRSCMAPGEYQYADQVWQAIAADPPAASTFITKYAPEIREWISMGSDTHRGMPSFSGTDFYNIIQAGTLGEQYVDPKLGTQATQALILAYQDDSGAHAPGQIQALYGQIVEAYWPDLISSITSPTPVDQTKNKTALPSPNGLTLTAQQWSGFVDEAMRDPKTGAQLLSLGHGTGNWYFDQGTSQQGELGSRYEYDGGLVDGFFDSQAQQVYVSLAKEGQDAGAWKDQLIDQIGTAVNIGVDVVADPGAAAKTIVVGAAHDLVDTFIPSIFNGALTSDPKSFPPPQIETWQDSYAQNIVDGYKNAASNRSFPVSAIQKYSVGAGDFIYPSGPHKGQVMPVDQMNQQQLAAFDAWLQDPQVFAWANHGGVENEEQQGYQAWITYGQMPH